MERPTQVGTLPVVVGLLFLRVLLHLPLLLLPHPLCLGVPLHLWPRAVRQQHCHPRVWPVQGQWVALVGLSRWLECPMPLWGWADLAPR